LFGAALFLSNLLYTPAVHAADSSVKLGDRTIRLKGVLKGARSLSVFLAPGEGNYFSPMQIFEGTERDGIRVSEISFSPPEARVTYRGESARLGLSIPNATPDAAGSHAEGGETACAFDKLPLDQFLDIYAILENRTVIRDMTIPDIPLSAFVVGDRERVVARLTEALRKQGLVVTNDSEKYVLILKEKSKAPEALSKPIKLKDGAQSLVTAGELSLQNMPFDQFLALVEMYSGQKVEQVEEDRRRRAPLGMTFKQQTNLTRAEVTRGFTLLLRVNGYDVEQQSNGVIYIAR
jgi:hypothetical protein